MKINTSHRHSVPMMWVLCTVLLMLVNTSARAGGLHLSGSIGYFSTSQNAVDNDHGNFVGTATVGVEVLGLVLGTLYAEFERTQLLSDGKWNDEDYKYNSDGVFLALRTAGPLYAIARVGFVKADFEPEIRSSAGDRDEAISFGVGYSLGLRNELLFTHIEHEAGGSSDSISFLIGF